AYGRASTCALSTGGSVKCWGYNNYGQLGLGDARDRGFLPGEMGDALPALDFGTTASVRKIALGAHHACAVTDAGSLFCWGHGLNGELGTESTDDIGTATGPTAVHLKAGLSVREIALGDDNTCVLATTGEVYCFGSNGSGQLGIGRTAKVGDRPGTMGEAM